MFSPYNQFVLPDHLQLSLSNALPIPLGLKFLTDLSTIKLLFFGILYHTIFHLRSPCILWRHLSKLILLFSHCHRTDWGLRSFAVAGPSSWNALPVDLRSSSFGLDTFAKHLKTHLFGLAYSRQSTHFWVCITFCRVRHGDSVTKPDYYYIIIIIITVFFSIS